MFNWVRTTQTALRLALLLLGIASTVFAATAEELNRSVLQLTGQTMGSLYTVKLVECSLSPEQLNQLRDELDARVTEINRQMSHYLPASDLSKFGRGPANHPFKILPEFAEVVRFALNLNKKSGGLFDPTIGPLIDLWGFGPKGKRDNPPTDAELAAVKRIIGAGHLQLTANHELIKDIPELQLDLGSITKGYAAREMARILLRHSVTNFYVAISGEVYVHGLGPAGPDWRIGIDEPYFDAAAGEHISVVAHLTNCAVSTSGNYRKYFRDANNRVYSHIIDPLTGRPTTNNLASVTVVTPDTELADGVATTAYLLGPERGLEFIENMKNASAFFIVRNADGSFKRFASKRFPKYEISSGQ